MKQSIARRYRYRQQTDVLIGQTVRRRRQQRRKKQSAKSVPAAIFLRLLPQQQLDTYAISWLTQTATVSSSRRVCVLTFESSLLLCWQKSLVFGEHAVCSGLGWVFHIAHVCNSLYWHCIMRMGGWLFVHDWTCGVLQGIQMSGSVVPAGLLMIERVPSISAISSHNIINSDCVVIAPFSIPTRLQFFQPLVPFNDNMFLPQIHTNIFAISQTVHRQLWFHAFCAQRWENVLLPIFANRRFIWRREEENSMDFIPCIYVCRPFDLDLQEHDCLCIRLQPVWHSQGKILRCYG